MVFEEAIKIFSTKFPELTVTKCFDYDDQHFVVEAVKDTSKPDYNSPYYAIGKKDKRITGFIPSLDLDSFFDAIEKRTVYQISRGTKN